MGHRVMTSNRTPPRGNFWASRHGLTIWPFMSLCPFKDISTTARTGMPSGCDSRPGERHPAPGRSVRETEEIESNGGFPDLPLSLAVTRLGRKVLGCRGPLAEKARVAVCL